MTDSLPGVLKAAVLAIWLLIAAVRSPNFAGTIVARGWPLLVTSLVTVLFSDQLAQSSQLTQGLGYLLISFALGTYYFQPGLRRERTILLWVLIADFAITGVRTLISLQTDPLLSRYLATTEENRVAIYGAQSFEGLAGYGFAYALAATLIALLSVLVTKRHKLPLLLVIAFGLFLLVELAFTTAVVLVLILGTFFLVRDVVRSVGARIIVYALAVLGLIVGLYSAILEALSRISWVSTDVSQRLVELSHLLQGRSSSETDLAARLQRWMTSIDLILTNGPFGLAGHTVLNQDTGGHSAWLDLVASLGVWALALFVFLIFAWRQQSAGMTSGGVVPLRRTWIFFLILGLVNTLLFSTVVIAWFFGIPALIAWLTPERQSAHVDLIAPKELAA